MSQQNGCCPVKMAGLYRFPSARHKHTHTQVVLQIMACSVCTTLHLPTQLQTIALSQYINVGWVWSIHKQSSTTTPHQGHLDAMIESRRSLPIASSFASLVLTGPHWSSLVPHWSSLVLTGPHWSSLVLTGPHWSSLVLTGPHWSSLVLISPHWSSLVLIGPHWSSLVLIGPHWSSLVLIGPHWSSLVLTGPHWSSLVLTGPHWSSLVLTGPHWSSLVLTGPHWSSLVLVGPHWSSLAHLHTYQTQVFSCSQESTLHRRVGVGAVNLMSSLRLNDVFCLLLLFNRVCSRDKGVTPQ